MVSYAVKNYPPCPACDHHHAGFERLLQRPVNLFSYPYGDFDAGLVTTLVERLELKPRVGGYIEAVSVPEGGLVEEGQLLFRIDPRRYRALLDAAASLFAERGVEPGVAAVVYEYVQEHCDIADFPLAPDDPLERVCDIVVHEPGRRSAVTAEVVKVVPPFCSSSKTLVRTDSCKASVGRSSRRAFAVPSRVGLGIEPRALAC